MNKHWDALDALGDKPEPIDWPARFRAADAAAMHLGDHSIASELSNLAWRLERVTTSDVVEAVGRALLGEEES